MTLPRNGLSGVEKIDVANAWKKSMAESEDFELRKKKKCSWLFFHIVFAILTSLYESHFLTKERKKGLPGISLCTYLEI